MNKLRGEFIVRNGYVLTMDPRLGDIPQGDVHVRNGQIVSVGQNLSAPGADVIDAQTMNVLRVKTEKDIRHQSA